MELELLNSLLQMATVALAPIVLMYTFLVYKGDYQSRSLPFLLLLGLTLGLSALLGVWSKGDALLDLMREACYFGAMVLVLFALRQYVHLELDLLNKGDLVPRKVARKRYQRTRS